MKHTYSKVRSPWPDGKVIDQYFFCWAASDFVSFRAIILEFMKATKQLVNRRRGQLAHSGLCHLQFFLPFPSILFALAGDFCLNLICSVTTSHYSLTWSACLMVLEGCLFPWLPWTLNLRRTLKVFSFNLWECHIFPFIWSRFFSYTLIMVFPDCSP